MSIVESIRKEFFPAIYDKEVDTAGALRLCLTKRKGLGKYALALIEFDSSLEIEGQISSARKAVAKVTKALWCLNEVGVYITFVAKEAPKNLSASELSIDKTGFHAVIVQGIHVIGPDGYHLYNHSKWLNHTFGGANEISNKLQAIAT